MAVKIPSYAQRMKWFHEARFGMFIHFGPYARTERGEWTMFMERIPTAEYAKYTREFNPKKFDAREIVDLAAGAGMKYMALTTRHHDGYCMFDSSVSDLTSVKMAPKRDFVAEYVEACRKAGLKVGLYYSLLDWRFPGYFEPKKYKKSAEAMVQQVHDQVRELMTNYGKIDVLWYDGHWLAHGLAGIKNVAGFWRAKELNAMVRSHQPGILINNRSGIDEDLDTPEQHVTASKAGRGWESCMTMGDFCGWGYIRNNPNYKSTGQLIQHLVTAAAGEGNFLLNIGPKPDGTIRKEETTRLKEIGAWMKKNGEAIYGSQRCHLWGGLSGVPLSEWNMLGRWTAKKNAGYLHIFRWPGEEAVIPLVKTKAISATILQTGKKVKIRQEYNGRLVLSGLPKTPPHPDNTVIKVEFAGPPQMLIEKDRAAWLTGQAK